MVCPEQDIDRLAVKLLIQVAVGANPLRVRVLT
jgi:hypothetical protein